MTSGIETAVRPSSGPMNSCTTEWICSSTADATAVADSITVRIPASSALISRLRPGRGSFSITRAPPSTVGSAKRSGSVSAKSTSARR